MKPEALQGVEIDIGNNADCFNSRTSAHTTAISSAQTMLQVREEILLGAFGLQFNKKYPDLVNPGAQARTSKAARRSP